MSRWGNCYSEEDESINFTQILTQHPDAFSLLQVNDIVDNVKARGSKFTKKIIEPEYRQLLHELIEIAINPVQYMKNSGKSLDKKMTHAAIEILTNLSEQFVQFIFDQEESQEDEVIQHEKEFPLMTFILKTLSSSVQETGLAYLSKIITPFIYQRPEEMLKVLNRQAIHILVQYFWSPSISELVIKIIEGQGQNDFFETQKLNFFKTFCQEFSSIKDENHLSRIVQGFGGVIDSLVEKHEDKYQRSKYADLLQKIIYDEENFAFLLSHLEKFNHHPTIKVELLNCIYAYLKIHEPIKEGSKMHKEESKNNESIKLNQTFRGRLRTYLQDHVPQQFASPYRKELLQYYKIVKMLLILDPQLSGDIITSTFITDTFTLMKEDPDNNILHNFQKDVLVLAVKSSDKVCSILQNEVGFDQTLKSYLSDNNSKTSYETQLFLIGEAVKSNVQEGSTISEAWSEIGSHLQNKRTFYEKQIGGLPRSNSEKWDYFTNDIILKPLEEKSSEQTGKKQSKEVKKTSHMLSGLEIEGKQVESQQEDDPFVSKNSHFIDDTDMPDLPIDSDPSQEGQTKNLKLQSSQDLPDLLQNSQNGVKDKQKTQKAATQQPKQQKTEEENSEVKDEENTITPPLIHTNRSNSLVSIVISGQIPKMNFNSEEETPFTRPNSKKEINTTKSPNKLDIIEQQVSSLSNSVNIDEQQEDKEHNKDDETEEVYRGKSEPIVAKNQLENEVISPQNWSLDIREQKKTEVEDISSEIVEEKQTPKEGILEAKEEASPEQQQVPKISVKPPQTPKKEQIVEKQQISEPVEKLPKKDQKEGPAVHGREQIELMLSAKYRLSI